MEKYTLDMIDNHVVAVMEGKKVLIDTGSPISIGDSQEIIILGQTYSLEKRLMDLDVRQISELIQVDINVILGMDILSKFVFYISPGLRGMICSDYFINFTDKMQDIPVYYSGTMPILDVRVEGVDLKMLFATGAKLSYLNRGFHGDNKSLGVKEDFYPGLGTFSAEVYDVPLEIKGNKLDIGCADPPEGLQKNLYMQKCNGVLGADIFRYFNIQFNFRNNRIWLVEKPQAPAGIQKK